MYRQFIEYQMLDISTRADGGRADCALFDGRIVVDPETHATDVAGLFAAGECTAGLHGANRLGGNSLTETVGLSDVARRGGSRVGRRKATSRFVPAT